MLPQLATLRPIDSHKQNNGEIKVGANSQFCDRANYAKYNNLNYFYTPYKTQSTANYTDAGHGRVTKEAAEEPTGSVDCVR
jgi:hypothetical protein